MATLRWPPENVLTFAVLGLISRLNWRFRSSPTTTRTVVVAVPRASAVLVARTTTGSAGSVEGAVYIPSAVIVPYTLPPSTAHVTPGAASTTVADNWIDAPLTTAGGDAIKTVGGGPSSPPPPPEAQAATPNTTHASTARRANARHGPTSHRDVDLGRSVATSSETVKSVKATEPPCASPSLH